MPATSGALVHYPDGQTKLVEVHDTPKVGSEIEPGWTITERHIREGDQAGGQTYTFDVTVEATRK
jgi:hypothetical protein